MMVLFVEKACKKAKFYDSQDSRTVCYLTLGDVNSQSDNRYYVRLIGKEAEIDWQKGDRLMLNLSLSAYKTQGQWQFNDSKDTINLIEIKGE